MPSGSNHLHGSEIRSRAGYRGCGSVAGSLSRVSDDGPSWWSMSISTRCHVEPATATRAQAGMALDESQCSARGRMSTAQAIETRFAKHSLARTIVISSFKSTGASIAHDKHSEPHPFTYSQSISSRVREALHATTALFSCPLVWFPGNPYLDPSNHGPEAAISLLVFVDDA